MKPRAIITFILILAFLLPIVASAGEIVIIVNENVTESTLSKNDIKKIFLGNKTTWDNGDKIVFVVQDRVSISDPFLKTYAQKSVSQYKNYWKQQVFTGKGKAPKSFATEEELVQFVSETSGAIGFVTAGAEKGNTKSITVQ